MSNGLANAEQSAVKARRRAEGKRWRRAFLFSALLHAVFFLSLGRVPVLSSPDQAAGPRAGDNRAARGSMQAVALRPPPPPVVRPLNPVVVEIEVEPLDLVEEMVLEPPPILGDGDGSGEGPGLEDGDGAGNGGDAAQGEGFVLPEPRQAFLLPHRDGDLNLQVVVWLDSEGRVDPDSTYLNPPTDDDDYNRRIIEETSQWMFHPARRNGVAVSTWYVYTVSIRVTRR